MKLSDMTDAEKRAFGSLVRVMVGADRKYSPDEADALDAVAEDLGADDFWQVIGEAGSHALDEGEVKAEAEAVTRKDVQERIYGVLFGIATAGTIAVQESRLLEWIADVWDLEAAESAS